jgi:peptidoglycan/xylan/chitin deacetylase (PgdA/CDA1 family)
MKLLIFLITLLLVTGCNAKKQISNSNIKNYIVLSFDAFPEEYDLDFAKKNNIRFSYFISAPFYITKYDISNYKIPGYSNKMTHLPWGNWSNYVIRRIGLVDRAMREGHSVGSHGVGHFSGEKWDYDTWKYEMNKFEEIINSGIQLYNLKHSNYTFYNTKFMKGFRAPNLSVNSNTYKALKEKKYVYDASAVSDGSWWVKTNDEGLLIFALPMINYYGRKNYKIIAMDYNFYWEQSKAEPDGNQDHLMKHEDEVFQSYMQYFWSLYNSTNIPRTPLIIGHHNNTNWNYNIYWSAIKHFVYAVHRMENVEFVTFDELIKLRSLK